MRHVTEEAIAWIVAQRSEATEGGRAARASLSQIAAAVGVSQTEVSRIYRDQAHQAQQRAK
jgi:AraC-like DNA-binding protein